MSEFEKGKYEQVELEIFLLAALLWNIREIERLKGEIADLAKLNCPMIEFLSGG
jgi:hypothetical protein